MPNKIPSSINPSEQFLDINEFFSSLEEQDAERKKENKKMDVRGFAIFQDKKSMKGGAKFVTSLKLMEHNKRAKDILYLADILAYEMLSDPRIMNMVSLALTKVLIHTSMVETMAKVNKAKEDNDNEKEKEQ